jgi:hypothetical protein
MMNDNLENRLRLVLAQIEALQIDAQKEADADEYASGRAHAYKRAAELVQNALEGNDYWQLAKKS